MRSTSSSRFSSEATRTCTDAKASLRRRELLLPASSSTSSSPTAASERPLTDELSFEDAQHELEQILERGYANVHRREGVVTSARAVASGVLVDVELADGRFGATVD